MRTLTTEWVAWRAVAVADVTGTDTLPAVVVALAGLFLGVRDRHGPVALSTVVCDAGGAVVLVTVRVLLGDELKFRLVHHLHEDPFAIVSDQTVVLAGSTEGGINFGFVEFPVAYQLVQKPARPAELGDTCSRFGVAQHSDVLAKRTEWAADVFATLSGVVAFAGV